jgi:hypothetical protein
MWEMVEASGILAARGVMIRERGLQFGDLGTSNKQSMWLIAAESSIRGDDICAIG